MQEMPNLLEEIAPEAGRYAGIVRVHDIKNSNLRLLSDVVTQEMICYFAE